MLQGKTLRATRTMKALLLATALAGSALVLTPHTQAWAYVPMQGYADLVSQVSPAVVYIEVTSAAPVAERGGQVPQSPFDEFLKKYGNPQPGNPFSDNQGQGQQARGLGSGYIISANGEIVTNHHVVENATDVKIKLQDGREFKAHVVGSDALTDVALLKIDNVSDLPVVPFGNSATMRVGDAVIAVGNPFGLGGTVTSGIISALGRDINFGPYDSYIQTDAAINRGNSGGPLFNTNGEVIGMNSAIFSPTGGSVGIGFSIPAETVQKIVAQLRDGGTVNRGWLGVQIQSITPDLASAIGLDGDAGALVADVQPDSPAMSAGMKTGDVILKVDGAPVSKMHDLPRMIAGISAGQTAVLDVYRDGKVQSVKVNIGKLSPEKLQMASAETPDQSASDALGITVQTLSPDIAEQLGMSKQAKGVVVTGVAPDSQNGDKLMAGDVIEEVGGQPVTTPGDLAQAIDNAGDRPAVLLRINRRGTPLYVGAEITHS